MLLLGGTTSLLEAVDAVIPVDTTPDGVELRAAVHQLVDRAVQRARCSHGAVPAIGSADWWAAPDDVRAAAVLVAGESWLVHRTPAQLAADQLKAAAVALSTGLDWSAASRRPSHVRLTEHRAEPGALARPVDPEAACRWAATGAVSGGEVA